MTLQITLAEATATSFVDRGITLEEKKVPIDYGPYPANVPGKNRGMAIIFKNEYFLRLPRREGCQRDCERLQSVLESFGFEIEICSEYRKKQILDKLETVGRMDHTNNECLLICVMTHGKSGKLAAFNTYYDVHELWSFFTEMDCPSLKGKPKLFFIQACRGTGVDKGLSLSVIPNAAPKSPNLNPVLTPQSETIEFDAVPVFHFPEQLEDHVLNLLKHMSVSDFQALKDSKYPNLKQLELKDQAKEPSESNQSSRSSTSEPQDYESDIDVDVKLEEPDMFVAFSSYYGFYSYRGCVQGSWFLRELCEVLEKCGRKYSLSTLMTFVSQKVAIKDRPRKTSTGQTDEWITQIPCIASTLTRPFYFYPDEAEAIPDNLDDIFKNT